MLVDLAVATVLIVGLAAGTASFIAILEQKNQDARSKVTNPPTGATGQHTGVSTSTSTSTSTSQE